LGGEGRNTLIYSRLPFSCILVHNREYPSPPRSRVFRPYVYGTAGSVTKSSLYCRGRGGETVYEARLFCGVGAKNVEQYSLS